VHPHDNGQAILDQRARRLALQWPWEDRADELAVWAEIHLVVRRDCHGRYRPLDWGPKGRSYTHKGGPTLGLLARHFGTTRRTQIVGLHVSSLEETCRAVWWDIDAHSPKDKAGTAPAPEKVDPEANLRFALHIRAAAEAAGLAVLLMDSNGKGGYHILALFREPIPMALAFRLGKFLARDYAAFGLAGPIETFPKNWRLTDKRYGNWVRLPGRHHTRDHWTRVWCPLRAFWLEGYDAIDALVDFQGRDVDLAGIIPADFDPEDVPKAKGAKAKSPRPAPARRDPAAKPGATPRAGRRGRDQWPADPVRDLALARAAIAYLTDDDADDRDIWIMVGWALKGLGDAGLALWHEFSARSVAKYDAGEVDDLWAGFRGPGPGLVGLGWLFYVAKERGWAGPGRLGAAIIRRRGAATVIIPAGPRGRTQPGTIIKPSGPHGRTDGATR